MRGIAFNHQFGLRGFWGIGILLSFLMGSPDFAVSMSRFNVQPNANDPGLTIAESKRSERIEEHFKKLEMLWGIPLENQNYWVHVESQSVEFANRITWTDSSHLWIGARKEIPEVKMNNILWDMTRAFQVLRFGDGVRINLLELFKKPHRPTTKRGYTGIDIAMAPELIAKSWLEQESGLTAGDGMSHLDTASKTWIESIILYLSCSYAGTEKYLGDAAYADPIEKIDLSNPWDVFHFDRIEDPAAMRFQMTRFGASMLWRLQTDLSEQFAALDQELVAQLRSVGQGAKPELPSQFLNVLKSKTFRTSSPIIKETFAWANWRAIDFENYGPKLERLAHAPNGRGVLGLFSDLLDKVGPGGFGGRSR